VPSKAMTFTVKSPAVLPRQVRLISIQATKLPEPPAGGTVVWSRLQDKDGGALTERLTFAPELYTVIGTIPESPAFIVNDEGAETLKRGEKWTEMTEIVKGASTKMRSDAAWLICVLVAVTVTLYVPEGPRQERVEVSDLLESSIEGAKEHAMALGSPHAQASGKSEQ